MSSPPNTQVVWDDVLGVAPELTATAASGRVDILAYVNNIGSGTLPTATSGCGVIGGGGNGIGGGDNGIQLRLARMYLAAHIATISIRAASGAAGPVTSEAAGGLRISYGLTSVLSGDPGLSTTLYGQFYLTIVRSSLAHGPVLC